MSLGDSTTSTCRTFKPLIAFWTPNKSFFHLKLNTYFLSILPTHTFSKIITMTYLIGVFYEQNRILLRNLDLRLKIYSENNIT